MPAWEYEMKIGRAIAAIRKSRNLSQSELGARIGFSVTTVSQIESDNTCPRQDTLDKICRALDTPELVIYLEAARMAKQIEEYSMVITWEDGKGKREGHFISPRLAKKSMWHTEPLLPILEWDDPRFVELRKSLFPKTQNLGVEMIDKDSDIGD